MYHPTVMAGTSGRRDAEGALSPPLLRLSRLSKNFGTTTAVHPVDLTEFAKAEGGVTCLSVLMETIV